MRCTSALAVLLLACGGAPSSTAPGGSAIGVTSAGAATPPTPGAIVDVKAANDHSCALTRTGEVWCWGTNRNGQLGDGTGRTRLRATKVKGVDDAIALDLAWSSACIVRRSGSVACWGRLLGGGQSSVPAEVAGATDVTQVSVAEDHACALRKDGTVVCWGDNTSGALGDGTTTSRKNAAPVPGVEHAVQVVAAGDSLSCAVLASKKAVCWGNNRYGRMARQDAPDKCTNPRDTHPCAKSPVAVPLDDVVELRASSHNLCARSSAGEVRCVGVSNSCARGEKRYDRDEEMSVPSVVPSLRARALLNERCAIDMQGKLQCWGSWSLGGLGKLPDGACGPAPVFPQETRDASAVAVDAFVGCAARPDGTVRCWGKNEEGALGDGTKAEREGAVSVVGLFQPAEPDGPTAIQSITRELAGTVAPGYGEIWSDADLTTLGGAPLGTHAAWAEEQRGDILHTRWAVRITKVRGEAAEIETLDRATPRCGSDLLDAHYVLTATVKTSDLAPVIARDTKIALPGDTAVTLGRGVAVEADGATLRALIRGQWRPLPIPRSALALSIATPKLESKVSLKSPALLDDRARLEVGDWALNAGNDLTGEVEPQGDHWAVTLANDCWTLRAKSAKDPRYTPDNRGSIGMGGFGDRNAQIKKGATAYWPNGEKAGTCVEGWGSRKKPAPTGNRLCFELLSGLTVCHDPADVVMP